MDLDLKRYVEIYGESKHIEHGIIIVMFDRLDYLSKHLEMLSPDLYDIILVLGYKVDLDYVRKEISKYKHNIKFSELC
ncbi:MAG: hypothetical protein N3C61_00370 [Candidatus Micrarchaeota archaeon]|nr:hypothetical protein [Candidatus Micrarchaeota archaeon]